MKASRLEDLRAQISRLDARLVGLLAERMELALQARRLKPQIKDPEREGEVLDAVARASRGPLREEFLRALFVKILGESRALQARAVPLAGFLGEHGAWGELAALRHAPAAVPIPCAHLELLLADLHAGLLDLGVVPASLLQPGGSPDVRDPAAPGLRNVGEVEVPISHCLCTLPEAEPAQIRTVLADPGALAQCQGYLRQNHYAAELCEADGEAPRRLAQERLPATAVIAGRAAAELHGLAVLQEGIGDHPFSGTSFVVLSR